MTNALDVKSATKTALFVALMSGSSYVAAQDISPPPIPAPVAEVQPAAPAPVAPPPVVRTLPNSNDVVNPAASQQVDEEQQAKSAAAAPAARKAATRVQPARPATATIATRAADPAPADPVAATPTFNEPSTAIPPSAVIAENGASADVGPQAPKASTADAGSDDLPLFGGIAAVLAALGLGGLAIARRRNTSVNSAPIAGNAYVAPAAAETAAMTPYTEPAFAEPVPAPQYSAEPARARPQVNTRPDVPVTDPLFSRKVVPGPITDPMFAPRNDVQTPITDPLFAKHHEFAGRLRDTRPAAMPTPSPEPVK